MYKELLGGRALQQLETSSTGTPVKRLKFNSLLHYTQNPDKKKGKRKKKGRKKRKEKRQGVAFNGRVTRC
jgi:hypothetical protein